MKSLPENFLKLMTPEARRECGQQTASEAQHKWQKGEERKMHELFEQDLIRRRWPYIHSRMDRKPTIREGWPDFTVFWGLRFILIEFKAPGGTLREKQKECIDDLTDAHIAVLVTQDVGEAIDFCKKQLEGGIL